MDSDNISPMFDMQTFSKESFSVDEFLTENRNKMTLENMRVEMGIFLKDLRNKMINSLNDDCDKYFHLSRGLIGIDQQLATLKPELSLLSNSVNEAKNNLENTLCYLDNEIQLNKKLCEDKQAFHAIIKVQKSLEKLDELLLDKNDCNIIILTRAVAEYNQLTSSMTKCSDILKTVHLTKKTMLNDLLMSKLNEAFVSSVSTNANVVKCFLELYLSLGRTTHAEDVCKTEVVTPAMKSILNENYLRSCKDGLKDLYSQCYELLQVDLKHLLQAAEEQNNVSDKFCKFNFVSKSFWPVIFDQVKKNLQCIYNFREPDIFIKNYKVTFNEFMKHLIELSVSQHESEPLHKVQSWADFKKCWNLPIYYQYRFQEIGFCAENVMSHESYESCSDKTFKLKVTKAVWDSMCSCLDPNIFIHELSHRFFKLILQLISRYQTWAEDANVKSKTDLKNFSTRIKFLEDLESDLNIFYFKLNDIYLMFEELLRTKVPADILELQKSSIVNDNLNTLIKHLSKCKVQSVTDEAMSHVIRVTDVPRLFRHTNRDYPNEPCAYMKSIVVTLKTLQNKNCKKQVLDHIVTQYVAYVDDVMKAIKKTEESLRKLKKIRDPNYKVNSDDDKIRSQLTLDIDYLLLAVSKHCFLNLYIYIYIYYIHFFIKCVSF
ncbi:conserved oligomeric Golgi complex subunit 2 [Acyrthosiphon pisum]|uniref:Conserved oligomeric Golgi complex subunit 2 n=1 Tax=Acyrthosiphon pisum TaxID=7029 RepID=A0A8R2D240_ACYPI|nr:conserved oligomeric Golgi complex subunit 2 [Acyrthosiphon pisum]|eukprot:XP_016657618.1 PREDICTED: conserved oligomeric Golgi complex subunit 2 [Acyrthosiphon pisum]